MKYEHIINASKLREAERMQAQAITNAANIDYLAMMADIEIPTDEEESEVDETTEV